MTDSAKYAGFRRVYYRVVQKKTLVHSFYLCGKNRVAMIPQITGDVGDIIEMLCAKNQNQNLFRS